METSIAWTYEGSPVETPPSGMVGFIYLVKNITTGMYYVGKKILTNKVTKPALKGKKRKRRSTKESNWRDYTGSCELLNEHITRGDLIEKHVIKWCISKSDMNYSEVKELFKRDVLEDPLSYNGNILGRYFKKI